MEFTSVHFSIGLCSFAIGLLFGFGLLMRIVEEGTKQRDNHAKEKQELESKIT